MVSSFVTNDAKYSIFDEDMQEIKKLKLPKQDSIGCRLNTRLLY